MNLLNYQIALSSPELTKRCINKKVQYKKLKEESMFPLQLPNTTSSKISSQEGPKGNESNPNKKANNNVK